MSTVTRSAVVTVPQPTPQIPANARYTNGNTRTPAQRFPGLLRPVTRNLQPSVGNKQQPIIPLPSRYENSSSGSIRNRWPVNTRPRANARAVPNTRQPSANVRPNMQGTPRVNAMGNQLNRLKQNINRLRNTMSKNQASLDQLYKNMANAKTQVNANFAPRIQELTESIKKSNSNIQSLTKQGQNIVQAQKRAQKNEMARLQSQYKANKQQRRQNGYGFDPRKSYAQRARNFASGLFRRSV